MARGDALFVEESFTAALDVYDEALSTAKETELKQKILRHRSACYFQLDDYERSRQDAEQAEAWYRRGRAALALERHDEARQAFTKALEDSQDADRARVYLTKCGPAPSAAAASSPPPAAVSFPVIPKYQYYQSDKFVTVIILQANLQPSDFVLDLQSDSLAVQVPSGTVLAGNLYAPVNVDKSSTKFKDEKVLIKLWKEDQGFEWPELWGKGGVRVTTSTKTSSTTSSRSRPYASPKDWNQVEQQLKEEEAREEPQGEDAMNKLFQQIYRDADEDTRRAMIKSYQTSGGTVLSTNWDEVSRKDYEKERTAPDGMEWKTWEGDKA